MKKHTLFALFVALAVILSFAASDSQALAVNNSKYHQDDGISTDALANPQDDSQLVSVDTVNGLNDDFSVDYAFNTLENMQRIDQSRIETFSTNMPQFDNRERTIIVYLPSDYTSSDKSYPVIYLQAAQDVFSNAGSSTEWYLNLSRSEFLTSFNTDEAIIVGITYDFSHYWDEYSPWVNENMHAWVDPWYAERVEGGEGDTYLDFLIESLKPDIDNRYRTLSDRENTTISGYDMGGLISLYAGLTRSETFSKAVSLSPAVWFAESSETWLAENHLLDLIESTKVFTEVTFYIDVGTEERRTDLEVQPDIFKNRGKKITYAQAYLEGAQVVIDALTHRGLSLANVANDSDMPTLWVDDREDDLNTLTPPAYSYNFPLFYQQDGMIHFDLSMNPYLNRTRRVWVYLPPDYSSSNLSYPVFYVMDALRQFNPYNSSTIPPEDDWNTDEKLDSIYHPDTFPGIIVVGIEHHSTTYRWSEYNRWTHYNMDNWVKDGSEVVIGEGDAYVNFIINNLKPMIDRNFRTLSDRKNTAIGGGSRTAFLAINAGLTHPETFSKVMAMSPAIWLAEGDDQTDHPIWLSNNRLIKWINNNTVPTNVLFYIYIGGEEVSTGGGYPFVYRTSSLDSKITYPEAYWEGAHDVISALTSKGISPVFRPRPDGQHSATYWRSYLFDVLQVFGFY